MLKQIDKPRNEVSKYAPKIINMKIKTDKIKDVIGIVLEIEKRR